MPDPQIDVLAATRAGAQQLGAQIADLTLELTAQQANNLALQQRITDLERQLAEKDDALDATRAGQPAEA